MTVVLRPLALAVCVLALAGCGAAEPGVEAVGAGTPATAGPSSDDEIALEVAPGPSSVPAAPAVDAGGRPRVAVVGDSLTDSASDEIEAALAALGVELVALDGVENRRMTTGTGAVLPGSEAIGEILTGAVTPPHVWVVALGTNDVGGSASTEAIATDVQALLDLIPPDADVVWVDLWIRDRRDAVVAANAAIRQTVGRRPGSAIADWFVHGEDQGVVTGDGVHLTEEGRQVFARAIADAIADLDR